MMIDIHLHFNEPGRADWKERRAQPRAGGGGGTLFFDMPLNSSPARWDRRSAKPRRRRWRHRLSRNFALLGRKSFPKCLRTGRLPNAVWWDSRHSCAIRDWKSFAADDWTLYEACGKRRGLGFRWPFIAESAEIVEGAVAAGDGAGRARHSRFLESRPVVAEVEANRACGIAGPRSRMQTARGYISSAR